MVVNPDRVPKDWDANSSKTQELGDENMGARRNVAPQIALGGHFSLTPLIYVNIRKYTYMYVNKRKIRKYM